MDTRVKEKITEAVPDAKEPYQLHDVLRAIQLTGARWTLSDFGLKVISSDENGVYEEIVCINLALPLDEQEPEVIEFIGKVLGV